MAKWPSGKREEELVLARESGESIASIAKRVGVSESTVRLHLNGIVPLSRMVDTLPSYPDEIIRIEGDCALTSDWHAPFFSIVWLRRLLAVSKKLNIHQLAIVGDLTDMKWISSYLLRDGRGTMDNDMRIMNSLISVLLGAYDRVYWSRGNHEDRLIASLHGQDILPSLAGMMSQGSTGQLIQTSMPTMLLNGRWRLEHPKTYSRDAARVASQVANIFQMNVAAGHGHFIGYKHEISGKYVGLDLGGMFDADKQEYLHMGGATTHPRWNPGFWIYRNGKPDPFDDALVNWGEWEYEG